MAIVLPPLPYPEDALAPAISAETLRTHHGKHHAAYVEKTNEAAGKLGLGDAALEEIIAIARDRGDAAAFDNAAQAWNHAFYWQSLKPGGTEPDAELAKAIDRDFGSLAGLREELATRGEKHFGSGWVWLASDSHGILSVAETHDGDTLALGHERPLLAIDLWEHAYYLDHKNERPAYLEAVIGKLLAWDFAARNYASGDVWRYPD